jgi:radical SAM family uncharacterized protein
MDDKLLNNILYQVQKPARYTGNEWNCVIKNWDSAVIRIALAFPDVYEIGMSNMAIPILYKIINDQKDALAERVYAPWPDMETLLRASNVPLFSLETRRPLKDFDIVGFSMGYELGYTNVLNILDMAGIPVLRTERNGSDPLIIGGGSCGLNPEPMSDFFDIFIIGEAEETMPRFLDVFREFGKDRGLLLRKAAAVPGIYVPSLYEVTYNEDGTINSFSPTEGGVPARIQRQIFSDGPVPVTNPVVPFIEIVHDHAAIEIQRGCARGCRFCQAGMIYRPVRELSHDQVINCATELIKNCGHNEVSLVSLSSGDYHDIKGLINRLKPIFKEKNISLSLPSLHLDKSSIDLIEALEHKRKITLTFAPEAGSERLRRAINKNISESLVLETLDAAFSKGWMNLKLYFMIGLPTETLEDVEEIVKLVDKVLRLGNRKRPGIRINVSTFVPKAHTPCQWSPQDSEAAIIEKQEILKRGLRRLGVKLSWQDVRTSQLEAVMSRGDRRIGKVIYDAWKSGAKFDYWSEYFDYQKWLEAFKKNSLDPVFYSGRNRPFSEILPWHHIDTGVTDSFLQRECNYMTEGAETPDCRVSDCNACGMQRFEQQCLEKSRNHRP